MEWTHLKDVLERYGRDVVERLSEKLAQDDHIASGRLMDSLDYRIQIDDNDIAVWLKSEDYLPYIEKGTKPHWPPREPIEQWIRDKGIEPYPDKNGRLPTVQGLAFLIARKISREGTPADPVLEDTLREVTEVYLPEIEQAIVDDLDDEVRAIMIDATIW